MLTSAQLSSLFAEVTPLHWLSGDISQDRTPELRLYLMRELDVAEVTPETVLPKLSAAFLEGQSDAWILRLYEFLNGQAALKQRAARAAPGAALERSAGSGDDQRTAARVPRRRWLRRRRRRCDGQARAFCADGLEISSPSWSTM